MLKLIIVLILFVSLKSASSQSIMNEPLQLKLKDNSPLKSKTIYEKPGLYKKADMPIPVYLAAVIFFINPILVFEDKKIFGGLTKEISFSIFPYGRVSFEYSFLFRQFNKHHLHISYNYDFMLEQGREFFAFHVSPGTGFFTDTKNKGIFGQLSFGCFIPAPFFLIDLYVKYRYTNTLDKNKSDIHDISLGSGLIF